MCIIAVKQKGVAMPDMETIRNMWYSNRDGAGFMYADKGKVYIRKGFMTLPSLEKALKELEKEINPKRTGIVLHFRIATHGGVKPENCHPFPVTDAIPALQKLNISTNLGIAHNGIITSVSPRKNISDTMEYIAAQLAPLKRAVPNFYQNKDLRTMIYNAIESKMAILDGNGDITLLGKFEQSEGIMYSNTTYQAAMWYRGSYWDEGEQWYSYYLPGKKEKKKDKTLPQILTLMWLSDGDFIETSEGDFLDSDQYLIDASGHVYEYDFDDDMVFRVPGYRAVNRDLWPVIYNPNLADYYELKEVTC